MNAIVHKLESLEEWFDKKFGWFFTNGNKV